MSLKVKALLQLVGLIGLAFLASLSLQWLIHNLDTETFVTGIMSITVVGLLYTGYQLLLLRLESQESIKKLEENYRK